MFTTYTGLKHGPTAGVPHCYPFSTRAGQRFSVPCSGTVSWRACAELERRELDDLIERVHPDVEMPPTQQAEEVRPLQAGHRRTLVKHCLALLLNFAPIA